VISGIPMEDRDTKGDLYEYLLSKIAEAGVNGQFRTPRHIIKMMVELVSPQPEDVIGDPACGTCGFLVAADEYPHVARVSELGAPHPQPAIASHCPVRRRSDFPARRAGDRSDRRTASKAARATRRPGRDAGRAAMESLRAELLDMMYGDVTRMNPDNFIIRRHRRHVDKYRQRDAWNQLGPSDLVGNREHMTRLPTPGAVNFLKYYRFGCCAFECRFVFGVGGVAARRYRRRKVFLRPCGDVLRCRAREGRLHTLRRCRFQQCGQAG
jgi:hypothetical protein